MLTEADRHAWENAGTFEVAPGVHRIPLPLPNDGLKAVNVYAVADGDQVVLIDGGWALAESQELLGAGLATIGYRLDDVREFLCTHVHRDHYTQAIALRRIYGSKVSLGAGEQAGLDLYDKAAPHPDIAALRRAGAADLARKLGAFDTAIDMLNWEYPDTWLEDGIDIELNTRTLRVINTPGHTRGHVVFHDPAHHALFAGDHVLPHITPSIGVEFNRPPSPLRDYMTSLELIRALPDTRLFPAHGPVAESVHVRIDELLAHHEARLTDTAKTVEAGASSAFDVARALPWTRHLRRFDDLDVFNQMLAVHETMAHLIVLVERGWLASDVIDQVARFRRA